MTYLKGMKEICKRLEVSSKTVKKWHKQGAPIFQANDHRYDCVFESLLEWLEQNKRYPQNPVK